MIRAATIAFLGVMSFLLAGCNEEQGEGRWDGVKIGDVAEPPRSQGVGRQMLVTANIDVHIYEVPAENVGKLENIWQSLYMRAVRFYNYRAFNANLFRVGLGKRFKWSGMDDLLLEAGGRRMAKVSLLLSDDESQDIIVTELGRPQETPYIGRELTREKAVIGPGVLALRVKGRKVPGTRGATQVTAYPVFSLPIASAIEPLVERARREEVKFTAAGFAAQVGQDDFIVLGPRKYLSETMPLPGLFFSNPEGVVFLSRGKPPERKPSFRVFVLVCTGIGY